MGRKILSIALIIAGLSMTFEVAFYFSEYSRIHKVFQSGQLGYDIEQSKRMIALASGYNSYDSMVKRERFYFFIAFAIAILMSAIGFVLFFNKPKIKNDHLPDYLNDEIESLDQNQTGRFRL